MKKNNKRRRPLKVGSDKWIYERALERSTASVFNKFFDVFGNAAREVQEENKSK